MESVRPPRSMSMNSVKVIVGGTIATSRKRSGSAACFSVRVRCPLVSISARQRRCAKIGVSGKAALPQA